jgi:hypothetical protein
MIPSGDTTSIAVKDWAHEQAAYLDSPSELALLLVLCHHAFYQNDNPEGAPVGQVMHGYSSLPVLAAWTAMSERNVRRVLWSLQVEHGYLIRSPRPLDQRPGQLARVIRIYWTLEHDAMRASARAGGSLPDAFKISARQVEIRDQVPKLHVVRDEVEQLPASWT